MKQAIEANPISIVSDQLAVRFRSLGVPLVSIDGKGAVSLYGATAAGSLEQLIVRSPMFESCVRRESHNLRTSAGKSIELWPGVRLVILPNRRRRRVDVGLIAAALIDRDVLDSDQLRLICDTHRLDYIATRQSIDRDSLLSRTEVKRLSSTLAWMYEDALEIERRHEEIQKLSTQLGESYEELSLLYKLSSSMTVDQPQAKFLDDACSELREVMGLKWLCLLLIDDDPRFNELSGQLFTAGHMVCERPVVVRIGKELMSRMRDSSDDAIVVEETGSLNIPQLDHIASQLLVVPLSKDDKRLGVIFGGEKLDESPILSVDSKLCSSLANSLAIFIENMCLYDDMQSMFIGTLHALTSSIDAKDKYTRGHSERVALLSRMLAIAAGLDEQTVERVYISGLVHDVGKIGVPESTLTKTGRLNDEEFAQIKMHPEIGAGILSDIRQMHDIIPGVMSHHERWDGNGYPHRKAGMDIPLFGRLICLADSFDAMSSTRTYRQSMDHGAVLEEIKRCAGTQFDPELAEIFLKLDFGPFRDLIEKHQAAEKEFKKSA